MKNISDNKSLELVDNILFLMLDLLQFSTDLKKVAAELVRNGFFSALYDYQKTDSSLVDINLNKIIITSCKNYKRINNSFLTNMRLTVILTWVLEERLNVSSDIV